jgi:succinoglycan biosynthesis protein ExoA
VGELGLAPKISINIPVRPGGSVIALDQLRQVDYPAEKIEVIVAEGHCPPRQRNLAVAHSGGEIVYCLDDDSMVPSDLFERVAAHYADQDTAVVGGPSLTPSTDGALQRCIGYVLGSYFGTLTMHARYSPVGEVRWSSEKELITCNLSLRREMFCQEGGFDEAIFPNDETELLSRLAHKGYKLIYDPSVFVERSQRRSYGELARQFFSYGTGRMKQIFLHPSFIIWRFLLPLLGLLYLVTLPTLVFIYGWWPLLPLVPYIAVTLLMAVYVTARERDAWALGLLPLLYPIIHVCYGAGLSWELLREVCRGGNDHQTHQETVPVAVVKVKEFEQDWNDESLRYRLHP